MKKNRNSVLSTTKFKEAINFRKHNNTAEAKKLFLEILNEQPGFTPALSEMGEILVLEGDIDNARKYFIEKLEALPDALSATKSKRAIDRLKGTIEGAIEHFEIVPQLSRQKLKAELREKDALLIKVTEIATANALLTSFAHQVNNPLQIIQSIIFKLKGKKQFVKDDMIKGLDKIQENANRIHDLIKHQNKLVGNNSEDNVYFNLIEVIQKAFEPFEEQLSSRGISKNLNTLESNENCYWVYGNPIKMEELFINLIANARDALNSIERPEIKISIENSKLKEKDIVIYFSDNGKGISKDNLKLIFHAPFTTKKKGTGLGLLLVYSVVNQMGGKIKVKSKVGKGAKFIINLPNKGDKYGKA